MSNTPVDDELQKLIWVVTDMLLDGPFTQLDILRKQLSNRAIKSIRMSNTGFFAEYVTAMGASPTDLINFELSDVGAEKFDGLRNGCMFTLFIRKGLVDWLEGYAFDEPWPDRLGSYILGYINGGRISATNSRDYSRLAKKLSEAPRE